MTSAADKYTSAKVSDFNAIRQPIYIGNDVPVLIILGQSNADGRGLQADVPNLAGVTWNGQVKIYNKSITRNPVNSSVNRVDNGSWVNFDYNTTMVVTPQGSLPMGIETPIAVEWARKVYPTATKPLHIIKCAIGGTPLGAAGGGADTDWTSASGQIWDLALNWVIRPALRKLVLSGSVPKIVGVFWGQGESDADSATNSAAYEANLRDLITNRIRAKTGFPDARVLVMGLSNYTHSTPSRWAQVKAAQIAVTEGANALENCKLIRTDGSDSETPAQRYMAGVGAGDIHYSSLGFAAIGAKVFESFEVPGTDYTKSNDVELVVARLRIGQPIPSADITYATNEPGGIVAAASLPALVSGANVSVPSISWLADPSVTSKANYNQAPMTKFRLVPLDGSNNVEVIWQMAHNGNVDTKPGILLRCTTRAFVSGTTDPANDGIASAYLVQVRSGGGQLTIFKLVNGVYTALAGSPVTPTQSPLPNVQYWYKVTLVGSVLTVFNSPDGLTWTQQYTVTDTTIPSGGSTYFTLFNGLMQASAPYAAHCHFPVLIANKL